MKIINSNLKRDSYINMTPFPLQLYIYEKRPFQSLGC